MYCRQCGAENGYNTAYCTSCGAPLREGQPEEAAFPDENSPEFKAKNEKAQPVLTMGILALIFSNLTATVILGIVFGAIGLKRSKAYRAEYGELTGKAKTGTLLARLGLIIGIFFTVVFTIIVFLNLVL